MKAAADALDEFAADFAAVHAAVDDPRTAIYVSRIEFHGRRVWDDPTTDTAREVVDELTPPLSLLAQYRTNLTLGRPLESPLS